MHFDFYFIEQMVKEKERQWMAEADRLRQGKAINSTQTNARKRKIGSITGYVKTLGAFLFRKQERLICRC
jgi:hypothetical protein